jgi:CHAT domain-containing protein
VRSLAGDRSVLHFATHGVIRIDDPLESFLALDTGRTAASRVDQPSGWSDTRGSYSRRQVCVRGRRW